jgi:hypothetical protein
MYCNRDFVQFITHTLLNIKFCLQPLAPFWSETQMAKPAGISRTSIQRRFVTVGTSPKTCHGRLCLQGLLSSFPCRAQKRGAERPTTRPVTKNGTSSYSLAIFTSSFLIPSRLRPAFPCPDPFEATAHRGDLQLADESAAINFRHATINLGKRRKPVARAWSRTPNSRG